MYPGERAADTLKQTELPLSFKDRVKTKDVMRSSVPANGESGLKTSDALKEEEYIRYLESRKEYFCCRFIGERQHKGLCPFP